MFILSAKSISKSYAPDTFALKEVSFDLKKGQILAVLGQSGSGKTTLIRILSGLLQPDSGTVLFKGEKLEGPEEKLVPGHEAIRLVHQDFRLHHRMTVEENVKNALIAYTSAYKQERTSELLTLCKLDRIRGQFVHEISGGEKQRVAIAMALSTEPEILLFDEPFSNLDYHTKTNLLQEISNIANTTKTSIILITHDSRDAMEVADQMLVLHHGKVIRRAPPREVYKEPNYRVVANLLGLYTVLSGRRLVPFLSVDQQEHSYGIWPEDVLLHKPDGLPGRVKSVVFSGSVNKLLITSKDFNIWAYDYSGKLKVRDKVKFSLRYEKIFMLK